MYFQLRTGVADLNNPDFAIIDTSSEPNNRLDTKLNTKSAATFGGELGYDFGGVRVGLELAYQRNKVKGITLKILHGTAITRSEEHTSELQSLMRISYAVFCLNKNTLSRQCATDLSGCYLHAETLVTALRTPSK